MFILCVVLVFLFDIIISKVKENCRVKISGYKWDSKHVYIQSLVNVLF